MYSVVNAPVVGAAPFGDKSATCHPTGLHLLPTAFSQKTKETRMQTSVTTKTLILAALLIVTGSVSAEWVEVASTDSTTFYIDPATIRKDGNMRKVWVMQDFKQRQKGGEMSTRARVEYDCKGERYRLLSLSVHPEPMTGGETIASYGEDPRGVWQEIPPGTGGEALLKIVCAK